MPRPIMAGISTTPTAAVIPAALVIAVESASVTSIASGEASFRVPTPRAARFSTSI
jgi:hypothetical protein